VEKKVCLEQEESVEEEVNVLTGFKIRYTDYTAYKLMLPYSRME
jgi:hypothetical protein